MFEPSMRSQFDRRLLGLLTVCQCVCLGRENPHERMSGSALRSRGGHGSLFAILMLMAVLPSKNLRAPRRLPFLL